MCSTGISTLPGDSRLYFTDVGCVGPGIQTLTFVQFVGSATSVDARRQLIGAESGAQHDFWKA